MGCTSLELYSFLAPVYGESGICADSESAKAKIRDELNVAVPLLLKRLDSRGTLFRWKVPAYEGCFALPYDCLEVRQAWFDGRSLELADEWYEGRLDTGLAPSGQYCNGPDLIDLGDGYPIPYRWPAEHFDNRLAFTCDSDGDAGKKVQVRFTDRYGTEIEEFLTLKPDQQLVVSDSDVSDIRFVKKPVTNGIVNLYIYYPQSNARVLMCRYTPRVTIPSYRKKKLPFTCGVGSLVIKGKLRFFPITSENDPLIICDAPALGFAFQALTAFRRGDLNAYNSNLTLSVNELVKDLENSTSSGVVKMPFRMPWGKRALTRCWA